MPSARILCVINSLEGGGAERVFVGVVEALARTYGRDALDILLLDNAPARYAPPPGIRLSVLGARGAMAASLSGAISHAAKTRPHVILSFLTRSNCAAVAAAWRSRARVLISQRVHASAFFGSSPRQLANRLTVRAFYPRADRVLAVSAGVADDLAQNYGVARRRLSVIYNPLDVEAIRAAAAESPETALPDPFYVAVGRLTPKKNHPMLLHAYARARPKAGLIILGEGPQRAELEALAASLGIAERVRFLGFVANPHALMARAKAFVSASNSEGFPNALVEALALGRAAAFTDCDSGPAEILGRAGSEVVTETVEAAYGLLVPPNNIAAMAAAFEALENDERRARLGRAALARSEDFAAELAWSAYVAELDSLLPTHLRRLGEHERAAAFA